MIELQPRWVNVCRGYRERRDNAPVMDSELAYGPDLWRGLYRLLNEYSRLGRISLRRVQRGALHQVSHQVVEAEQT